MYHLLSTVLSLAFSVFSATWLFSLLGSNDSSGFLGVHWTATDPFLSNIILVVFVYKIKAKDLKITST